MLLQPILDQLHKIHRTLRNTHAGFLERVDFLRGGASRTRDDRTGVTHASSWRRSLTRDETNHRLRHVITHELGGFLFVRTTDFSHHRHRFRLRILLKRFEAIDEVGAVDGITTDTDTRALANAIARELIHDFIRERTGTANDTNIARRANATGNDANL